MSHEQAHGNSKGAARARSRSDFDPAQPDQPAREALPPRAQLLLSLQPSAGNRAVSGIAQRLRDGSREALQDQLAVQPEPAPPRNDTGLPDGLKSGVESLSGVSLDDVNVHYNSDRPAQLDALAYTQGTDIHVSPGQEQHLSHEAWHVVQQSQGRVRATTQIQGGLPVNDDEALEQEADAMGAKASATAAQHQPAQPQHVQRKFAPVVARGVAPVQRVLAHTHPIVGAEVNSVRRVGGKLVYILDGGVNGQVVVKFEVLGSAREDVPKYADRSDALRSIAAGVLQNVPGTSPLTNADMGAIAQIPAAVGGDLQDLQQMAAGVLNGAQTHARLLAMKMEHINVGQNLDDLVRAAVAAAAAAAPAPGMAAVPGAAAAPARPHPVLAADPGLWGEFGKMAAFDLLVSNNDRFSDDDVNLQNVDMRGLQGVSLDVVDPNSPLLAVDPWEGEAPLNNPTPWAQDIVGKMFDRLFMYPMHFNPMLHAFLGGFNTAKAQLKAQHAYFRGRGLMLGGHGQAVAGSRTYRIIAVRLGRI